MSQDTATAVATKLFSLWVGSEGGFDSGEGLNINENFRIQIVYDPEAKEEYRGSYTIEEGLHRGFCGPVTRIEIQGDHIFFLLQGPFNELRSCNLKPAEPAGDGLPLHWVGELKGPHFDPESGSGMMMTGKCTGRLTSEEGHITEKKIALKGVSSLEDAEALARLSGIPVRLIMQAFRIPHPEDEVLLRSIKAGEQSIEGLMKTAMFGGNGPLAGEVAVVTICERLLNSGVTRTEYNVVKDEE